MLKNALPQVLAVMGLQFGYLIGGSILVETVFTWPGTGFLLSKAIINRDIPVLQGTILVLAMFFVATNLVVDLLQIADRPAHPARLTAMSQIVNDVHRQHGLRRRRTTRPPLTRARLLAARSATGCATIRSRCSSARSCC